MIDVSPMDTLINGRIILFVPAADGPSPRPLLIDVPLSLMPALLVVRP
jgi:hypothetical protein